MHRRGYLLLLDMNNSIPSQGIAVWASLGEAEPQHEEHNTTFSLPRNPAHHTKRDWRDEEEQMNTFKIESKLQQMAPLGRMHVCYGSKKAISCHGAVERIMGSCANNWELPNTRLGRRTRLSLSRRLIPSLASRDLVLIPSGRLVPAYSYGIIGHCPPLSHTRQIIIWTSSKQKWVKRDDFSDYSIQQCI